MKITLNIKIGQPNHQQSTFEQGGTVIISYYTGGRLFVAKTLRSLEGYIILKAHNRIELSLLGGRKPANLTRMLERFQHLSSFQF